MFIDLSGFSTITDALMEDGERGAEQLTSLMHSVFDPLVRSVFEQGGMIVGFAGDGITALYPADDLEAVARNALASAWAIQRKVASIASLHTRHGTFPISAKVGLACGEVSWRILKSRDGRKATYYFRGSAVDESAEAEHHARPGDIVLASSAHDRLSGLFTGEPIAGFTTVAGLQTTLPAPRPVAERPVDVEAARIFVSDEILTQDLRGEFRQVVNLFMRLPLVSDDELQDFAATLFDLQGRYGGLIGRMDFGDKGCNMLMFWGAPTTYENDIRRALNFAVDLRSLLDFPITAGITTYIAHAGYVGGALCEDYSCHGWGANLAARFMMAASDGDIWVDERIVERASRSFQAAYLREQDFKGFAQKQKVYLLRGRKAEDDWFYEGKLAGRDLELQQLSENVKSLWRGEYAGITLIEGEAGIGKSRLVLEFKNGGLLAEGDILWALCPSDQVLKHSFNPFRYWLLRYFNILYAQEDSARLQSINAGVDQLISDISDDTLIDDLLRARSFLAALVDVHWPDSPYERMDAQGRYDNTLLALIALLKAESLRRPVILLIEDAHALDEESKALLLRLRRTLAASISHPIAIIMTSRREGAAALIDEGFADHHIDLGGLPQQAMELISRDILGRPAASSLISFLDERAEGNPFFAEQMLHYLPRRIALGPG